MAIPALLDALVRAHGPAGHEQLAHGVVREAAAGLAEVESDTVGNLLVTRRRAGAPLLALYAHLDTIGLAVAHVADDGLLAVHTLGGWRAGVAYGQRVEISTARGPVHGVVARRVKDDEKVEWEQLYVDVGARDGAEARRLVSAGDPIVVVAPPLELAGGRVAARSLDNRAGVYVALEALRRLAEGEDAPGLAVVATAQEELGHSGVAPATQALRPDVALALDVTYATDVPAAEPNEAGAHGLGSGPAIFRGPAVSPRVLGLLLEAAAEEGIAHTVETGSRTFTDADDTFASGAGLPTGLVSIPLRYMHSPGEIVQLSDLEDCIRLVVAFARRLRVDDDYRR